MGEIDRYKKKKLFIESSDWKLKKFTDIDKFLQEIPILNNVKDIIDRF